MTRPKAPTAHHDLSSINRIHCPAWCVSAHSDSLGEEDWLHTSKPVPLAKGVRAQLVMSIEPETCDVDGPYVMIGDTEFTLAEAASVATALLALASASPALHAAGGPSRKHSGE